MNKNFLFILFTLLFLSCATKKTTLKTEYIKKVDTLIVTKDRIITERFTDTIMVKEPCDSLGNLRPFKQSINVPQGKIEIVSVNGSIQAKIDLKAYESIFENKYRIKYENKIKESSEEIIRYKTPLWLLIYSALITVICALLLRFK
jgi:hypothetical protein